MLNKNDRIAVIQSQTMQQRVQACVTQYALYLLGNSGATASQKNWAVAAMQGLQAMAAQVAPYILSEPNFLGTDPNANTTGSDITDANLQSATETAVNNYFVPRF